MNIIRVGTTTVGNTILVTTDSGATVYAVSGGKVVSGVAVGGVAKLKVKAGTWRVWAEKDGQQTSEVEVIVTDSYYKEMSFGLPLSSLAEGALVQINESGSGVNFYLAKHDYESGLNGAGRELLVRQHYHSKRAIQSGDYVNYHDSPGDVWLNGTYKLLLDNTVQALISTTKFYYTKVASQYGSRPVEQLTRSVFLLSATEMGGANSSKMNVEGTVLPIANTLSPCYDSSGANATAIWTRSPTKNSGMLVAWHVETTGAFDTDPFTWSNGIRPCFTLPATEMVNPTPNADGSYTLMV